MMYQDFFSFGEPPFSIVPNSRYLFLSQRHKEAIQHLEAGLGEGGGFAMLTGEVGTGKTTVAKVMLANLGEETQAGLILNPTFSDIELLEAICDEFSVSYPLNATLKQLSRAISAFLLRNHSSGVQTLLVIDEAQHLAADVLEQLRLLTNLETDHQKLLKVLLIGQPELQQKLKMPQLRQLAQRVTGRYHLLPLTVEEGMKYIQFRLETAGGDRHLFPSSGLKYIAIQTQGIPRLMNLVCDAVLKSAYHAGIKQLNKSLIQNACHEVMQFQTSFSSPATSNSSPSSTWFPLFMSMSAGVVVSAALYFGALYWLDQREGENAEPQHQVMIQPNQATIPAPNTQEVFSTVLLQQLKQSSSLERSIQSLYQVWGYQASVMDRLCLNDNETPRLFHCEVKQGSWQDILQQNIPVVLHLTIENSPSYAVLYRTEPNGAIELIINEQRVRFDGHWLKQIWNGEYHFIWQSNFNQMLKKGMTGEQVVQLDSKLSKLIGEVPSHAHYFDEKLEQKVKLFQRWQGMEVDGIAGKRTLKALELLTQENAPKLTLSSRHSNSASVTATAVDVLSVDQKNKAH